MLSELSVRDGGLTPTRPHTVLTFVIMEKLQELVNMTSPTRARATV
jgi:hypothetical protein